MVAARGFHLLPRFTIESWTSYTRQAQMNAQSLVLKTFKPVLGRFGARPIAITRQALVRNPSNLLLNQDSIHNRCLAHQSRSFASSSVHQWKSIGSPNKNRKTRSKLKTHQGAAKRFFVTGRGQFKRVQAGTQHLMTGVAHGRKRRLKPMIIVNKSHANLLRKLMPYVGKRAGFRKLDQSETVWWKSGKLQKTGTALEMAIKRANQLAQQQQSLPSSNSPKLV